MADNARINVALSRAKERLIIIGAGNMWKKNNTIDPLSRVYDYIDNKQNDEGSEYQIVCLGEKTVMDVNIEREKENND